MLRVLTASLLVALTSASFCGDSAIPFSVEVLPDGQLMLGCARPTCFGWAHTGTPATNNAFFYRINGLDDGFMRAERSSIPAYDHNDSRYYRAQTATCDQSFAAGKCGGVNQWVGGIAPLYNVTAAPIILRCCAFEGLLQSEDRGLAAMTPGQIVVGGEVMTSGIQAGFDYISDIGKVVLPDGTLRYDVWIRRMPCAGLSDRQGSTKYQKSNSAQAFQAPTEEVDQPLPLPPSGNNGNSQNGILEEIVQEEAIQLPPGTNFEPVQQPVPPPQFQPAPFQPPVQQAVAPQYYSVPVQFGSGGGGGGQWCFSADMTVEVMGGESKRMDELTKQDWVLAVNNNQLEYVPVEFWLHRVPSQEADFNEFETADGKTIKLTDKHYIYKGDCSRVGTGPIPMATLPHDAVTADQVHAGDCLFTVGEFRELYEVRVVRAGKVKETGIYAPMTSIGKIIVNGVHASCHNIHQEHTTGQTLFKYVDWANSLYEAVFGANPEVVETPAGLSLIIEMAELVVPKNLVPM